MLKDLRDKLDEESSAIVYFSSTDFLPGYETIFEFIKKISRALDKDFELKYVGKNNSVNLKEYGGKDTVFFVEDITNLSVIESRNIKGFHLFLVPENQNVHAAAEKLLVNN